MVPKHALKDFIREAQEVHLPEHKQPEAINPCY